jgi:DNA-binding NarL/FixJ family response regulator
MGTRAIARERSAGAREARARTLRLETGEILLISIPLRRQPLGRLTSAERAVARRAAAGESNRTIAEARGCSQRTVANQLAAIFEKLGVRSRAELASNLVDMALEEEAK